MTNRHALVPHLKTMLRAARFSYSLDYANKGKTYPIGALYREWALADFLSHCQKDAKYGECALRQYIICNRVEEVRLTGSRSGPAAGSRKSSQGEGSAWESRWLGGRILAASSGERNGVRARYK